MKVVYWTGLSIGTVLAIVSVVLAVRGNPAMWGVAVVMVFVTVASVAGLRQLTRKQPPASGDSG